MHLHLAKHKQITIIERKIEEKDIEIKAIHEFLSNLHLKCYSFLKKCEPVLDFRLQYISYSTKNNNNNNNNLAATSSDLDSRNPSANTDDSSCNDIDTIVEFSHSISPSLHAPIGWKQDLRMKFSPPNVQPELWNRSLLYKDQLIVYQEQMELEEQRLAESKQLSFVPMNLLDMQPQQIIVDGHNAASVFPMMGFQFKYQPLLAEDKLDIDISDNNPSITKKESTSENKNEGRKGDDGQDEFIDLL